MSTSPLEHAAMLRALALAASPGVPTGPNPRVGCVLLDDAGNTVAEGWHRGAGSPHAEADALRQAGAGRPRHDRRRDPRALQPHRSHRPVRPGAGRGRRTSRGLRPARPEPRRRRGSGHPARRRGRGRGRAPRGRGSQRQPGVDLRHGPRPSVRDVEVRHHARRPQRRGRRHQPLGLLAGRPRRHPPAAGPLRHDARRRQHRGGRRPAADRPRRRRPTARGPAPAGRDGPARPARGPAGLRRLRAAPSTCAPATRTRRSRSCSSSTASTSSSRAGPRWPRRSGRPGSSTRSSRTSPRCCSAPAARPSPTWASAPSPTPPT